VCSSDLVEAFIRTERGERPILQDFGIEDPAFSLNLAADTEISLDLLSEFHLFYPNIGIADIATGISDEGTIEVEISYE